MASLSPIDSAYVPHIPEPPIHPLPASPAAEAPAPEVAGEAPVHMPAVLAMPQTITLRQLADLNPKMQIENPTPATLEEIQEAVKKGQFHQLKDLFDQTASFEFQRSEYNLPRRDAFIQGFTELHKHFQNNPSEDPEIIAFARGGRGAEAMNFLAKIPFFPQFNDPEYGARMMVFIKQQFHFRSYDLLPGVNRPLSMVKPGCKKEDVALEGSPFLPTLLQRMKEVETDIALPRIKEVSKLIAEKFTEARGTLYVRGMPCSGKSTFLENEWKVPEPLLIDTDSLRNIYGGPLWQHVAARTADLLATAEVDYKVVNKTNLYPHNLQSICTPPIPGSETIVCDFIVGLDTALQFAKQRAAENPDRGLLPAAEMEELHGRSASGRPSIVKAALANPRFQWHCVVNDGKTLETIASIVGQKLTILNQKKFDELCEREPAVAAAFKFAKVRA